jgi:adenosylcobalamin-dependent ribonucleoside-triphosphate reductase
MTLSNTAQPSIRAQITERRTYLRPLNDAGTLFETPKQAVSRMIEHQTWLWERAKAGMRRDPLTEQWELAPLDADQVAELEELRQLLLDRKVNLSGRTRWLGGTSVAKTRESSQFNCSFLEVRTVHDVVDVLWLLLQGCGVGFRPIVGNLNGFAQHIDEIEVIRSFRTKKGGNAKNVESFDPKTGVWTIVIGDSAEAWAKSIGKIVAGKYKAKKLVLDLRQIRPAGERLKGYGWISSGDEQIAVAFPKIAQIFNKRAGKLLTRMDILDLINWLGTILSSRRSAEIALFEYGEPEWDEFAVAKKDHWIHGTGHRQQSNNSLLFTTRPVRADLEHIFKLMVDAGGSEPGFMNLVEALRRAPWAKGTNPCGEILLGDHNFCNLVETVLSRFNGDLAGLLRAHWLVARANYRQTCVWLDDGILQRSWHELNEFLRLCGVGVTGVVAWAHAKEPEAWQRLRAAAQDGAHSMADELHMPRSQAVTTIKPSGTQSKASGIIGEEVPEGLHKPLGRYIFNHMNMSKHDPLVKKLQDAGYYTFPNPSDSMNILVRIPVEYGQIPFEKITKVRRGYAKIGNDYVKGAEVVSEEEATFEVEVNLESAIDQLERYKLTMLHYTDHNSSITVSYDVDEVPAIINWLLENWDTTVGVSFLFRHDPTKTAEDLGYEYMPQDVVDRDTFHAYADTLREIDWDGADAILAVDSGPDCATGACPVT